MKGVMEENTMKGVMVDLETLSIKSRAVIVSIGAVEFDTEKNELGPEFYSAINIQSCLDSGLIIDGSTLTWWLNQDEASRAVFKDNTKAPHLAEVLQNFSRWYPRVPKEQDAKEPTLELWGNGANFDNVVLTNAYQAVQMLSPVPFWNDRCYRTLKNLCPQVKAKNYGIAHNALDDAKKQAIHLLEIMSVLNN